MNLTKRKLLAILSLELLLYSFLYLPILFVALMTIPLSRSSSDPTQELTRWTIILGPPLLWLALNAWMARKLILMGPFSERNWRTMRFGLKCMGAQVAIIAVTFFSFNLVTGFLSISAAIVGLVAAAVMESEKS